NRLSFAMAFPSQQCLPHLLYSNNKESMESGRSPPVTVMLSWPITIATNNSGTRPALLLTHLALICLSSRRKSRRQQNKLPTYGRELPCLPLHDRRSISSIS